MTSGFQRNVPFGGLVLQDGDPGFQVGYLDIGTQSPLEAGKEAVFDPGDFRGGAIGAQDDLPACLVQFVEDVEELFLRLFLASEELHVIDDQQIDPPVEVGEARDAVFLNRSDELGGELFARHVEGAQILAFLLDVVADGLDDMGLPKAHASVDHEWIEARPTRVFGDGQGGTPHEPVGITLDEGLERVFRLEPAAHVARRPDERTSRTMRRPVRQGYGCTIPPRGCGCAVPPRRCGCAIQRHGYVIR